MPQLMVVLEACFFVDQNRRENALTLPPSTPPPGPVLGDGGIRSGAGEGQRSAGSGFEGDSVRLSAGEE